VAEIIKLNQPHAMQSTEKKLTAIEFQIKSIWTHHWVTSKNQL